MDDGLKQRSPRQAKKKAIEALDTSGIVNPGTKKRGASTHEPSDRAEETRKRTPSSHVEEGAENVKPLFHRTPSPHVEEDAENIKPSSHRTPATKPMASHTGLTEKGTIV